MLFLQAYYIKLIPSNANQANTTALCTSKRRSEQTIQWYALMCIASRALQSYIHKSYDCFYPVKGLVNPRMHREEQYIRRGRYESAHTSKSTMNTTYLDIQLLQNFYIDVESILLILLCRLLPFHPCEYASVHIEANLVSVILKAISGVTRFPRISKCSNRSCAQCTSITTVFRDRVSVSERGF